MSTHTTTNDDPVAARKAAESWVRKFIRDAYERQIGMVTSCEEINGEWVLLARFPDEAQPRRIWMSPRPDKRNLDFISPGSVKARYRPPTEEDLARVKALLHGAQRRDG